MDTNEVSWVDRDIWRYKEFGTFIPQIQIDLYKSIRDHWCSGRIVMDIGCGAGYGSNILSHTARHVWGIDVNEEVLKFAKHMYERPNLSFELFNVEVPPERPLAKFEVVTMIEVLEHLVNFEVALGVLKGFFSNKLNTVGFITVPNLNNPDVAKRDAENELHVNHWNPGQFYELLTKHFDAVTLYSNRKLTNWVQDETTDGNEKEADLVIAKVEGAL